MNDKGLAPHVQVDTSPERLSRVWQGVESKLESERTSRRRYGIAAAGVAAAGYVLWLFSSSSPADIAAPSAAPTAIAARSGASDAPQLQGPGEAHRVVEPVARPSVIALDDGRVELAANSRVELIQDEDKIVGVKLLSGRVDCDLKPKPHRRFTVDAAGVQVKVKGTRFSVALTEEGQRVEVAVERGLVEVLKPGAGSPARQLGAGEFWSTKVDPNEGSARHLSAAFKGSREPHKQTTRLQAQGNTAAERPLRGPVTAEPLGGRQGSTKAEAGSVDSSRTQRGPLMPHTKGSDTAGEHDPAVPAIGPEATAPSAALDNTTGATDPAADQQVQGEPPSAITTRGLMTRANTARRQGNPQMAAQLYGKLLRQSPGDARAGLAAFELGRLQMDRLGNLAGAVKTLRRAMAIAPGSAFREDATARLVRAYAALGAQEKCKKQRSAYLRAYPNGVHRTSILRTCDH